MTAVHRSRGRRALGHTFVVEGADPTAIGYVEELFSGLPAGDGPPTTYTLQVSADDRRHQLLADGQLLREMGCFDRVLAHLLWHVNQEAAARTPDRVLLHAGAVASGGRAVLLPAESGAGKSTLVAALVGGGYDYLSDELAPLDPATLTVTPFAKPISIGIGSWLHLPELHPVVPEGLSTCAADEWYVVPPVASRRGAADEVRPAAIVWPAYEEGSPTTVERVDPVTMATHLLSQTFHFPDDLERNFRAVARLTDTVPCYRLTVGELSSAVAAIDAILAGERTAAGSSVGVGAGPG